MLFGSGTGNGLDFRDQAFENDSNFTRVPVKERIFIISVGGDIGQTADVVKTRIKEKKDEEAAQDEAAAEERRRSMEEEEDPEVKAAKQRAIEAREELKEAERKVKEADDEVEKLERTKPSNLDAADQGAIQGATQSGIDTAR